MLINHKTQASIQSIRNKYSNLQGNRKQKSPLKHNLSTNSFSYRDNFNKSIQMKINSNKQIGLVSARVQKTGRICRNSRKQKYNLEKFNSSLKNIHSLQISRQKPGKTARQSKFDYLSRQLTNNSNAQRNKLKSVYIPKTNENWLQKQNQLKRNLYRTQKLEPREGRQGQQSLRCIQNIQLVQRRIKSILLDK